MSKKNESVVTAAMILFKDRQILNERPEGMKFKEYKRLLRMQSNMLNVLHTHKPDRNIAKLMEVNFSYNQHFAAPRRGMKQSKKGLLKTITEMMRSNELQKSNES
jgi:hypothetical protein